MIDAPAITDQSIAKEATLFRAALDAVDPATWARVTITRFPRGACGHASELLGRFLHDRLGIDPLYVVGDYHEPNGSWRGSHAWLEYDGIIIDISGDQFGWPPVIVARESAVHAVAEEHARQALNSDARWWGTYCAPVYSEALRWIASRGENGNSSHT